MVSSQDADSKIFHILGDLFDHGCANVPINGSITGKLKIIENRKIFNIIN
jgi:hypothetical protein